MGLTDLKPPRGWRAFFGEVGIIVLGVLIALAADQGVTTLNRRSEMRELRTAVDNEVAFGLATYEFRLAQQDCVEARLDELSRWLRGWREGKPVRLEGSIWAPLSGPPNTSVWDGREPAVVGQMPLQVKLAYGAIYDGFANAEVQRLDERMTWFALAEFDEADSLDAASMMRLQGLITRAHWRANNLKANAAELKHAAKLGIEPLQEPADMALFEKLCRPILPQSTTNPSKENSA